MNSLSVASDLRGFQNAALEDPHLKQMLKGKTKRASEAVSRLRNPVLPKPTLAQLLDLLDGGTTMQNMQVMSLRDRSDTLRVLIVKKISRHRQ